MEDEDLFNFDTEEQAVEQPVEEQSFFDDEETTYEESDFQNDDQSEEGSDFISKLLESRGIKNKTIQFEDENGEMQEINWDDLTDEEKFDILSDSNTEESTLPTEEDLKLLNYFRTNNMTLDDFAKWQREEGVKEYLSQQQPITEFDNYSDEEIVAYDYIQRFGEDMSDEEIDAEIERLKADPEAFEKRVSLLRNSYKSQEEAQAQLYQQQEEENNKIALEKFKNSYIDAARGMDYIHGMNLDNNDKEQLLQFVLDKDASGRTGLAKALDNPESVLKMAWYLQHAEDTYDATVDHFKKEISNRSNAGKPRAVSRQQRSASKDAFKFN